MAVMITGVFSSRDEAEAAVEALRERGFPASQVGVVVPQGAARAARRARATESALTWVPRSQMAMLANIGSAVIAGQIAECATREAQGPAQIHLSDILTRLGIEPEHAVWYEQQVAEGYSFVIVRAEDGAAEAQSIMRRFGSLEVPSGARIPRRGAEARRPARGAPTPAPSAARDLSRVKPGFDVCTIDGARVGTVQEASPQCIHVLCCSNLFVPPSRIQRVTEDQVILNVAEADLETIDWSTCAPSTQSEYRPGGAGYSGLPPQEHEPGVELPVDPDER